MNQLRIKSNFVTLNLFTYVKNRNPYMVSAPNICTHFANYLGKARARAFNCNPAEYKSARMRTFNLLKSAKFYAYIIMPK